MPAEPRLELGAVVGPELAAPEREALDGVSDEVDRTVLIVTVVESQGANARGVVNRRVLEPADAAAEWRGKVDELHIELDVMPRCGLPVPQSGHQRANRIALGQPGEAVAPQRGDHAGDGALDAVRSAGCVTRCAGRRS